MNQNFLPQSLYVIKQRYPNGNLALRLISDQNEPIAEVSINIQERTLAPDEIIAKNFGENTTFFQMLVKNGSLEPTAHFILIGREFCPICKVKQKTTSNRMELSV